MLPKPSRSDAVRNRARVVEAAVAVFTDEGTAASTERIAARAHVGIGTVFRHFPTKTALLEAALVYMFEELTRSTTAAVSAADPGAAFFDVLGRIIDGAATKRGIADALGGAAADIHRRSLAGGFRDALSSLLASAQATTTVRPDVGVDEVIALIVAAAHAAEHAGTNNRLRDRSVALIFDGLRTR
jgi:AcrR family transcriptional regulator